MGAVLLPPAFHQVGDPACHGGARSSQYPQAPRLRLIRPPAQAWALGDHRSSREPDRGCRSAGSRQVLPVGARLRAPEHQVVRQNQRSVRVWALPTSLRSGARPERASAARGPPGGACAGRGARATQRGQGPKPGGGAASFRLPARDGAFGPVGQPEEAQARDAVEQRSPARALRQARGIDHDPPPPRRAEPPLGRQRHSTRSPAAGAGWDRRRRPEGSCAPPGRGTLIGPPPSRRRARGQHRLGLGRGRPSPAPATPGAESARASGRGRSAASLRPGVRPVRRSRPARARWRRPHLLHGFLDQLPERRVILRGESGGPGSGAGGAGARWVGGKGHSLAPRSRFWGNSSRLRVQNEASPPIWRRGERPERRRKPGGWRTERRWIGSGAWWWARAWSGSRRRAGVGRGGAR